MSGIPYSRSLSARQIVIRGSGVMVTVLVFALSRESNAAAGALAPLALLFALLLVVINLLGYSELASSSQTRGGAYSLVREAEGGALAFFTGWALTWSTLGLCALIARELGAHVAILLRDFFLLELPVGPLAAGLVFLLAASNALGSRDGRLAVERGFLLVILLILGIIALATPHADLAHPPRGPQDWQRTLTLVISAFLGLEITASLQKEVRGEKRKRTLALMLTPALAAIIGAVAMFIVHGVAGSSAGAPAELPLSLLGAAVFGEPGRILVTVVGAVALTLAFNSVFVLAVRQIYSMTQDGYWPSKLLKTHHQLRTPIWIIILASPIPALVAQLHQNLVGQLTALLYLLVLMGVNLTLSLQSQSESSAFTLPFHPWVPGLTLFVDVLVLSLWTPVVLVGVVGCLGLGLALYLGYARGHHVEAQKGITVFKPPPKPEGEPEYQVLVPVANPETAGTLLRLAGVIAGQQGGQVLALQVVTVPEQVPLEEGRHRAAFERVLLEHAMAQANEEGFDIQTMTRVAHSVAEGILDAAREEQVDLILMGWRGRTRSAGASLGPILDTVIRDAPCEIAVVNGKEWRGEGKILVPTGGGPNARTAARLAKLLSNALGSEMTVAYVQRGRATPRQMEENEETIAHTLEGLELHHPVERKIIVSNDVTEGIIREAEEYDLVLMGASEESVFDHFVFGSIPQQVAARVSSTVVIARRYGGATEVWTRRLRRRLLQLFPRLTAEQQLELREAMRDSARPGANFFVLLVLSAIIAALGLLMNSAAVVIGAMLVAPLMSPILGFSLGIVLSDVRMIRRSGEAMFKGVTLALLLAVFIGLVSPFKQVTDEILMRTRPTLLDLGVALASGMAGAYALSREEVSAALPGVAISAALMPPLAASGLGLSLGLPTVAGGAFLLFLANIAAISLAGVIVFVLLGVRAETWKAEAQRRLRQSVTGFLLLLLVVAIPLGVIGARIVREARTRQQIQAVLNDQLAGRDTAVVEFEHQFGEDALTVVATIRSTDRIDEAVVEAMASALEERLNQRVRLEVIPLEVIRSGSP